MDDLTRHDSPAAAGDDYQHALAEGFLPIRDVARLTGVQAVTLRAWERRYGLIVPQRTPKGHRLYSEQHVAQIQTILTWLNRGVTVGQVKGLLLANQPAFAEASSQWDEKCQRLQDAICNLAERRLQAGYTCPCLVIGPAAHIHHQALQALARQNSALGMAPDPLSALHILSDLNLLDNP